MIRPRGTAVAAALFAEALLGEPPEAAHPVVLMGRAISVFERRVLALKGERRLRLAGLFLAVAAVLPALSFALARLALRLTPPKLRWPLEVGLLTTALSMRGLARSALAVERELEAGNLEAARTRVGELVGRDTEHLTPGEIARAAVESVTENTSDGVVAPMVYGLFFGAPGALVFEERALSTRDSAGLVTEVVRARGIQSLVLVTDPLHCVRALGALRAEGFEAWASPVYSSPMWRKPWQRRGQLFRETVAVVWYRVRRRRAGSRSRP